MTIGGPVGWQRRCRAAVRGQAEPQSQVCGHQSAGACEFLAWSRCLRRVEILLQVTRRGAVGFGLGGGR